MIHEYLERRNAYGIDNTIHGSEIAREFHLNRRETCDIVQAERRQGILICAARGGYFLPDKDDEQEARLEVNRTIKRMKSQADTMEDVVSAMQKAWEARSGKDE